MPCRGNLGENNTIVVDKTQHKKTALWQEQVSGSTVKPAERSAVEQIFPSNFIMGFIHHMGSIDNEDRYN